MLGWGRMRDGVYHPEVGGCNTLRDGLLMRMKGQPWKCGVLTGCWLSLELSGAI